MNLTAWLFKTEKMKNPAGWQAFFHNFLAGECISFKG